MTQPQLDRVSELEHGTQPMRLKTDDLPSSTSPSPGKWSEIRAKMLSDPVARERYERKVRSIVAIRRMLQMIDAERERAGLSKSALARKIGATPATVRRLFTSPTSNPTLKTVVDLFTALDLEIEIKPREGIRKAVDSRNIDRMTPSTPSVTR
jgi:ribosome-binding protein aMBF1 (putative translation factor)